MFVPSATFSTNNTLQAGRVANYVLRYQIARIVITSQCASSVALDSFLIYPHINVHHNAQQDQRQ
jgi:hypothetical protein